jgi:macrolide-specific efflux system membrane fusion protein
MNRISSSLFVLLASFVATAHLPQAGAAEPIPVESVLIRLIEEVEVPAQEEGLLAEVLVKEGDRVRRGDLLARLDDETAQVAVERASTEVAIAERKAGNDVSVRFARKATEVAQAELARAKESIQKYPKSISDTEIDKLTLTVDRSRLEIEQAEHLLGVERLTQQLKQQERAAAQLSLERRKMLAPIDGVVVEVNARPGEWMEPGEKVLRILRMDRLRAEGFIAANQISLGLLGSAARVTVDLPSRKGFTVTGQVVFVSPEIDPVNGQVRVWVEIENPDLLLRPGLHAKMGIAISD